MESQLSLKELQPPIGAVKISAKSFSIFRVSEGLPRSSVHTSISVSGADALPLLNKL